MQKSALNRRKRLREAISMVFKLHPGSLKIKSPPAISRMDEEQNKKSDKKEKT